MAVSYIILSMDNKSVHKQEKCAHAIHIKSVRIGLQRSQYQMAQIAIK